MQTTTATTLNKAQQALFKGSIKRPRRRRTSRELDLQRIEQFIQQHGVTVLPPTGQDFTRRCFEGLE